MAITLTELFHKTSIGTGADYTSPTFNLAANSEMWIAVMGDGTGGFTVESNTGSLTFSQVDLAGPSAGPPPYRLHVFKAVATTAKTGITVTIDSGASADGYDVCGIQVYNGGSPFYMVQTANYDGAAGEPVTIGTLTDAVVNGHTALTFLGVNEDTTAAHAPISISGWTGLSVNNWSSPPNYYFGINAFSKTDFTGTTVTVTEYATLPTWAMGVLVELAEGTAPAFPNVEATAETAVSTAGTSHVISLPTGFTGAAGEIAVIILDKGSTSATFNSLAGWTEVVDENLANGITVWVRDTDGTEGSTVTFTSSASTRSAAIAFRISGALAPGTQLPELSTVATGTSTAPNATTCTPTGGSKNYLWVSFFGAAGEEADDDTWVNTPSPTGYLPDPPLQKACGTVGTNLGGMIGAAYRKKTASSEDAGAFSIDVSSAWRAYTLAIHPASTAPNQGASTGAIGWVGSATGVRTPKGAGNGSIDWVGGATGKKFPAGASTGAIAWVGVAVGGNLGVAIGSIQWVGSATGVRTPKGAGNGAISWVGSATGVRTPKGAGNGAISWVGSATGKKFPAGAATGALSWVGVATGKKVPAGASAGAISWAGVVVGGNLGVVVGSIQWVGSATGLSLHKGAGNGAISWVGSAVGETPSLLAQEGAADGGIGWIGTVSGSKPTKGSGFGTIGWVGVVVGGNLGVVIGSVGWLGSVTGEKHPAGSSTGAISWVGSVIGETPLVGVNHGSVDGSLAWVGSVAGIRTPKGASSGAISFAGVVVGGDLGVAIGSIQWVGVATGHAEDVDSNEGSVIGQLSWIGSVTGKKMLSGAASGAITWVGSVVATISFNRIVFLSIPGAVGRKQRSVYARKYEVAVGAKPRIAKGKDRE